MGNVVQLDPGDPRPGAGEARRRTRRRRRSKTALVLGGGGFTGGVYQIGALRALDLLSENMTVNDFDVYVGTSAGAFVAALAANGITPEEMMRVVNRQASSPFRDIALNQVLRPNIAGWAKAGALLPVRLARLARGLADRTSELSLMDVALGLAESLPSGVYSGSGIEAYVHGLLAEPGRSDGFDGVRPELYLTATDLDTCERIVFGAAGWEDVPISRAVAASTALPMVYAPVTVRERELIDGGIVSTTNLDIAVEAGARFIVVINPLVPYVNPFTKTVPTLLGPRTRRVSDMGFPQIAYQAFKLLAYQRLHEMAKQWSERYKGVDIVLVEPEPDDELMFQTSVMNYASRVQIARHGFESVTLRLASDYDDVHAIAQRHGIELSETRVRQVVEHFHADAPERTAAWRKILEQTTGALLRQTAEGGRG
jgi:predicted acylesterase/phospholipase RssA